MLQWRRDPVDWRVEQKFSDPGKVIRDDLYGAGQNHFLETYLPQVITPGLRVLDLGSGLGYFSNRMASLGADVLGLDPSERYLSIARANAQPSARFEITGVGQPGALDGLADEQFDLVFMSDALLFYFVLESPTQAANLDIDTNGEIDEVPVQLDVHDWNKSKVIAFTRYMDKTYGYHRDFGTGTTCIVHCKAAEQYRSLMAELERGHSHPHMRYWL